MFDTFQEAQADAKRVVKTYASKGVTAIAVITESKPSLKSHQTTFGFRFLVNEPFITRWVQDPYGHYHRMLALVS